NSYVLMNLAYGQVDLDPGPVSLNVTSGGSNQNMYAVKLDSTGKIVWARWLEGWYWGFQIETDGSDNVYITGEFSGVTDFDPGPGVYNVAPPPTSYNWTTFVWSLTSNGDLRYVYEPTGKSGSEFPRIAVSSDGHVVFAAKNEIDMDLDPGSGVVSGTQ